MEKSGPINFHMHPSFNYSLEDMPQEIIFDLNENEKVLKLIPIIKDMDNKEDISNKFKLGIVTSVLKTIEKDSKDLP